MITKDTVQLVGSVAVMDTFEFQFEKWALKVEKSLAPLV